MNGTAVLYEPQGPKAARRNKIYAWAGRFIVLGLIVAVVLRLAQQDQFSADHWAIFAHLSVWHFLFVGLLATLEAAALSAIFSLVLAFPIAFARLSGHYWLRKSAETFIAFFRAVPLLLLILFMTVLLPTMGFAWPGLAFLVLAMTLHHSALTSEILRSGILSLERGQREAALAIGMTGSQSMALIILPQALRRMLPLLVGQLLSIVQDTSLGYIIPYNELLRCSQLISSYDPQTLLSSAFVSTMMYGIISAMLLYVQRRLTRARR